MRRALLIGLWVGLALLVLPGCSEHSWDCECDLVVLNDSHCDLTIIVDGQEAFTVHDHDSRTLDDMGCGEHALEARDEDGRTVELRHVDLHSCEDYYWRIDDC